MTANTLIFRMIVRRVANGSLPFCWQVEREDTLAVVEVSSKRYRSMQEAYEAGQAWLIGFLASQPMPKRPPMSFGARPPRSIGKLADEPLLNFEDEVDSEDLMDLEFEDEPLVEAGW